MDETELTHIASVAAGLDRLAPQIGEAMRLVASEEEYQRLAVLLKQAEKFLIEAGPIMGRARPEPGPLKDVCERFMRELPRRLRMIRDAQAVLPPVAAPAAYQPLSRAG